MYSLPNKLLISLPTKFPTCISSAPHSALGHDVTAGDFVVGPDNRLESRLEDTEIARDWAGNNEAEAAGARLASAAAHRHLLAVVVGSLCVCQRAKGLVWSA